MILLKRKSICLFRAAHVLVKITTINDITVSLPHYKSYLITIPRSITNSQWSVTHTQILTEILEELNRRYGSTKQFTFRSSIVKLLVMNSCKKNKVIDMKPFRTVNHRQKNNNFKYIKIVFTTFMYSVDKSIIHM